MLRAEYIESGTFCASEEETYMAGIEKGEMVVVLTQKEYEKLVGLQSAEISDGRQG